MGPTGPGPPLARSSLPSVSTAQPLAHQFDDVAQQRRAVSLGMWAFLLNEVMFFGGLFAAYAIYRVLYPHAFHDGSHHLDAMIGPPRS